MQEAPEAVPASGGGRASPEDIAAGAMRVIPATFRGYLQVPGGDRPREEQRQLGRRILHVVCFGCAALAPGQSQGQGEDVFSRQEFSLGLALLPR